MSLEKTLDALEEKYYGELEEDKDAIIPELEALHKETSEKGIEEFRTFSKAVLTRFGGVYQPYVFWVELREFMKASTNRQELFDIIHAFTESGFESEETKKMKPLLITYFSMEKEFELDKIQNLIVNKAHPDVQEYFRKLTSFVEKSYTSVKMYEEKFDMLMDLTPDFDLLRMPVIKLKEHLATL